MATTTEGGSDPNAKINQGKTPRAIAKAASASTQTQEVKDMLLAPNYIKKAGEAKLFDTRLADWYRYGQPSEVTGTAYKRLPKTIDPMDNEAPASLRIFGRNKKNATAGEVELVPPFSKFILESMNEGHTERSQIIETFGTFYVFMFGERPPMYTFSGTLLNTKDINWRTDFQFYYDNYLRGSKCVENSAHLVMTYGGRQIEGFMLNFQTNTDAALEAGVKVTFQVVVTDRLTLLNRSADFGILYNNGVHTDDSTLTDLLTKIAGVEGVGLSAASGSQAHVEVSKTMGGGPASGIVPK